MDARISGGIAGQSAFRAVTDAVHERGHVSRARATHELVGVDGQLDRRTRPGDGAIVVRCDGLVRRIVYVVPARAAKESNEPSDSGMPIGARHARAHVPHHDAPGGNAPGYVDPDDRVSRLKQVVNPPQVNAFGNPGWPFSKRVY